MRRLFAALAALGMLGAAGAETVTLDDSASPRQQAVASFEWVEDASPMARDLDALLKQRATVGGLEYRLDTSAFVGRSARIYLEFPRGTAGLDRGGGAELSWRTRGTFIDGTVRQGERVLVFEGEVPSARMSDTFDFVITLDVRDITGPLRLAPVFVLETP